MTKASDNPFPSILIDEEVDPAAPAAGHKRLFIDSADHKLKTIDSSSTVVDYTPGGSGDVATDAIWDAAGDLAVGSGANTASKLTKGADGTVLRMASGSVGWGAIPYVGACVYNAGTQSINSLSQTVLTFDTEDFDTSAFHDTGSNTGRLTVPTTGKYLVTGKTWFPFTVGAAKYLGILLNADATPIRRVGGPVDASEDTVDITAVLSLAAADYVQLCFEHDNGSPQTVGHASARRVQSEFSITLLGV